MSLLKEEIMRNESFINREVSFSQGSPSNASKAALSPKKGKKHEVKEEEYTRSSLLRDRMSSQLAVNLDQRFL